MEKYGHRMSNRTPATIRVPREVYELLRERAMSTGFDIGELAGDLIATGLAREEAQRARERSGSISESRPYRTRINAKDGTRFKDYDWDALLTILALTRAVAKAVTPHEEPKVAARVDAEFARV